MGSIPLQPLTNKAPQNLQLVAFINSKKKLYIATLQQETKESMRGDFVAYHEADYVHNFFVTFRKIKKCFLNYIVC